MSVVLYIVVLSYFHNVSKQYILFFLLSLRKRLETQPGGEEIMAVMEARLKLLVLERNKKTAKMQEKHTALESIVSSE